MRIALFIFLACLLLASCKSFKEPDFIAIDSIQANGLGKNADGIILTLHYFNPNKSGLSLKKAEGDAWVNDKPLGHFLSDTLIRILPNSDFWLPVKLNLQKGFILQNMASFILNPQVTIKIEGTAKVGKAGVFIHYPIHYEGKQDLSMFIKR